jgi:hypothetical protein
VLWAEVEDAAAGAPGRCDGSSKRKARRRPEGGRAPPQRATVGSSFAAIESSSGTGAPPPSFPALCPHLDLAGEKGQARRGHAGSLTPSTGDDGMVQPGARASLEPWGMGRSRLLIRRREPRLLASAGCFLQNGHPSDAS